MAVGRQKAALTVIILLIQLCAISFTVVSLTTANWAYQSTTSPLNQEDIREVEIGIFQFCDSLVGASSLNFAILPLLSFVLFLREIRTQCKMMRLRSVCDVSTRRCPRLTTLTTSSRSRKTSSLNSLRPAPLLWPGRAPCCSPSLSPFSSAKSPFSSYSSSTPSSLYYSKCTEDCKIIFCWVTISSFFN